MARRAGDPARDTVPVLQVGAAEAAAQPPLFVAGDEQVEEDRHGGRVRQQRQRHEQPRLPQHDQQRGDVDRVAHPAVGPGRDDRNRLPRDRGGGAPVARQDRPRDPDSPESRHHHGEHEIADGKAQRAGHARSPSSYIALLPMRPPYLANFLAGSLNVGLLRMRAEELKGHLDAMLLAALEGGPRHGYAVIESLRQSTGGRLDLPTGTIYPALRRREYRLTAAGTRALSGRRADWLDFSATVSAALEGGPWPSPA